MLPKVVKEWLSEYKGLSKEEIHSYAASIRHNGELVSSLNSLFEGNLDSEILDPVCHQLFEFYRSEERELQRFSLELIPSLIWLYLSLISKGDKSKCGGVEAFLLAVYNLEICTSDGKPKELSFRIPSFSQHSLYHEPLNLSSYPLTESALSRHSTEPRVCRSGPYPQYESINGQNRHSILSYLLECYHGDICNLSSRSHRVFCKMCSRIVTTGFSNLIHHDDRSPDIHDETASLAEALRRTSVSGEMCPRIAVSPALLTDMLTCIYYIMFNGQAEAGAQAIADIHHRASYELYPDVLLITNAIRNSLREAPSGPTDDGPIGIGLALSPASSSYTLSKSAITNASFRTRKLPDDIPVQPDESAQQVKLATIDEDGDTAGKPRALKKLVKKDKGEKSRAKEIRNSDASVKSGVMNGDTVDSVQTIVSRGQQRTSVDSIELQPFTKTPPHSMTSTREESLTPLSFSGKHSSPVVKGSAMRTSISNKDIKNAKAAGHARHLSGGSVGSENLSTDL